MRVGIEEYYFRVVFLVLVIAHTLRLNERAAFLKLTKILEYFAMSLASSTRSARSVFVDITPRLVLPSKPLGSDDRPPNRIRKARTYSREYGFKERPGSVPVHAFGSQPAEVKARAPKGPASWGSNTPPVLCAPPLQISLSICTGHVLSTDNALLLRDVDRHAWRGLGLKLLKLHKLFSCGRGRGRPAFVPRVVQSDVIFPLKRSAADWLCPGLPSHAAQRG
jgi:hypothetical protein